MNFTTKTTFSLSLFLTLLTLTINQCSSLTNDGVLLLSFKESILNDPLFVLSNWNYTDQTPCSWNGVSCSIVTTENTKNDTLYRVTALSLPNSQLLGLIPSDLGSIQHLQIIDLSNNSLNGSLPSSFFQANSELRFLNFSNNLLTGEIPESITELKNLQFLNFSDNAFTGKLPNNLSNMQNLTVASFKNNYLTGFLPKDLRTLQILDLSSNLLNGSLSADFGGDSIRYLNVSYNKFSGEIPPEFAEKIPRNATVDLSFNNLTGEIPESQVFLNQETKSFSGNSDLCGELTKNPCSIPSSPSSEPKASSPAIAAMPKNFDDDSPPTENSEKKQSGLRKGTIIGIVIGDFVGIGILATVFIYVYKLKRKKDEEKELKNEATTTRSETSSSNSETRGFTRWSCLRKRTEDEESSETPSSSDSDVEAASKNVEGGENQKQGENKTGSGSNTGTLVTVDGERELEVETLLKASAYILGATGSSIMYKAVLEDGTSLAVRRIGESGVERFKDFENQVRVIAKLVHPNLVRVRGFYWGHDEKLIIYDYVPNGCLANVRYSKYLLLLRLITFSLSLFMLASRIVNVETKVFKTVT